MNTLEDRPPADTASRLRLAAVHALADDCTGDELRAWAANAGLVERIADRSGRPAEDLRNEMLAVSVVVDMITRRGYTPDKCRTLLGIPAQRLSLVSAVA